MADSGHKSRTSKTIGSFLKKESMRAVIPTNNGGDVTIITSYFTLVLNKPAYMEENTNEK